MSKTGFYKAIVKDNRDKMGMGRVRVYIPDFGGDPTDETNWYTASYMSPYAGQTNPYDNKKGSKEEMGSQDSYGMWANSYHPENEVMVAFVNGDINQPVITGSVFGQNMTSSIGGYPSNKSTQGKVGGTNPPTVEYNKQDDEINPRAPKRPTREILAKRLWQQGLFKDFKRGQVDTSPHRDPVPQFQSFKTPSGNMFAIDDGKMARPSGHGVDGRVYSQASKASPYIRMRSTGGTQYMMNSDCGFIYMNSKSGSSWAQIANNGIQFYTAGNMNVRAQGGYNQRSDGTHNLEVLGDINVRSVGPISIETDSGFDLKSAGNILLKSASDHSVKTGGDQRYQAGAMYSEAARTSIFEFASVIQDNSAAADPAQDAEILTAAPVIDREANADTMETGTASGPTSRTANQTTLPSSDLVTHEPWGNQPAACGTPSSYAEEGPADPKEEQPLGDGSTEEVPVEDAPSPASDANGSDPLDGKGRLSNNFGQDRGTHSHGGVDIAAPAGTPIYSTGDGVVTRSGYSSSYGNVVYVNHGNGVETRYAHMKSPSSLKVGDRISKGSYIGGVGSTGRSTGNHLHYEVRKNNKPVNPGTFGRTGSALKGG